MSSEENSQFSPEISIKEENYSEDLNPSTVFDCQFPETENQPPEYFFETDHVNFY
jgi:hypothetical protein